MDNTLEQLGIMTDYEKLNKRTVWIILGWSVIVLVLNCGECTRWHDTYDILTSIFLTLVLNYCADITIIDDLIFASILGLVNPFI